jgi:hypothetical protein
MGVFRCGNSGTSDEICGNGGSTVDESLGYNVLMPVGGV